MRKIYRKGKATIVVRSPPKFLGTWRFVLKWPGEKDLHNSARVYCGRDGRLKFKWAKWQGSGVTEALTWAANRAVREVGGKARICGD